MISKTFKSYSKYFDIKCNVGSMTKLERLYKQTIFFQEELVDWLAGELEGQQLDVDQVDNSGNSPLHLAMRRGHIPTVATLLHHGAKLHLKVVYIVKKTRRPGANAIKLFLSENYGFL